MKNIKKLVAVVTATTILGMGVVAYAATAKTPAEMASGLTGKTIEQVNQERASGKTYGTIAKEAGKLAEFKTESLNQKKAVLDERVKTGTMKESQRDQIIKSIEENQVNCDGTGTAAIGKKSGAGFGQGSGSKMGKGTRHGAGQTEGNGLRNGTGAMNGSGNGRGMNK